MAYLRDIIRQQQKDRNEMEEAVSKQKERKKEIQQILQNIAESQTNADNATKKFQSLINGIMEARPSRSICIYSSDSISFKHSASA